MSHWREIERIRQEISEPKRVRNWWEILGLTIVFSTIAVSFAVVGLGIAAFIRSVGWH